MANLSKLWSKQNQSIIIAECINNTLEVYLKVPKKHVETQNLIL